MTTFFHPNRRRDILARLCAWAAVLCGSSVGAAFAWRALLLAVAVGLGGCAALPGRVERPVSQALADDAGTRLGRLAAASLPEAGRSGVRLLDDGAAAFEARIALLRHAERSIDVQYYLIADDRTGREFVAALAAAAARGVRVRLLVDDLMATGQDDWLAGLAAHPGIDVRLFNPLPVRGDGVARRLLLSLHVFERINHRMHNKLLVVDGAFAVVGGRNIADAYFDRGGEANFVDMDLLAAGPVVAALAGVFDRFWNDDLAYPLQSLVRPATNGVDRGGVPAGDAVRPEPALPSGPASAGDRIDLDAADVDVLADAPDKSRALASGDTVAVAQLALLSQAHASVVLASPYFVPSRSACAVLASLRRRDVAVSVLTNSLATTDEPLVHLGYARHRPALAREGIELHELMPVAGTGEAVSTFVATGSSGRGASLGRLHTKLAVIDDETAILGSLNMDGRSAVLNTEMAVVVRSPVLARRAAAVLADRRDHASYRVRADGERLRWLAGGADGRRPAAIDTESGPMPSLPMRWLARWLGEDLL